jgi:hypothetical protein
MTTSSNKFNAPRHPERSEGSPFKRFHVFLRRSLIALGIIGLLPIVTVYAQSGNYIRDFWRPTFHIERLNYCLLDGKTCGAPVANEFCHLMGFEKSANQVIEYNVGLTHYIATNSACRGWKCHGFKLIQCRNKITHKPPAPYYYRYKIFVFPRYNHYRIAWCLEENKHCGRPAAYSFCRRLGFEKTTSFKIDVAVDATRSLGDQQLCFGKVCNGFKQITCYR